MEQSLAAGLRRPVTSDAVRSPGADIVMFEFWLRTGAVGVILVPFVLLYLVAAGIVWLTHLSPATLMQA